MDSRRSYLDTLNAGRQRRGSLQDDTSRDRRPQDARIDEITRRMQQLSEAASRLGDRAPREPEERYAPPQGFDRARPEDETVAVASRIAGEIKGLREEVRQQMSAGLRREFDALRGDFERISTMSQRAAPSQALSDELGRLSDAIRLMAERDDDQGVAGLRDDLAELKQVLAQLAREEAQRVRRFDERWDAFEQRHAQPPQPDPALAMLTERLAEIGEAVNRLPEALPLRAMEEKVRTLTHSLDAFSRKPAIIAPDALAALETRLDEISRAIVASSQPSFSAEPFERIEARIASLARQMEEMTDEAPLGAMTDRLAALSDRVEDLAERSALPGRAIEKLADQIAHVAAKLETAAGARDAEGMLSALEERFSSLADLIETRHQAANDRGLSLFRDLDDKITRMGARIEENHSGTGRSLLQELDARFAEMSERIEQEPALPQFRAIEARLDGISDRLDRTERPAAAPDAIRALESQIAELSSHLLRPQPVIPALEDIVPRLGKIEQAVSGNRDAVISAAREAAEDVLRGLGAGPNVDTQAVSALAGDLRSLESLARKSDDRNARTFEAIHDTLLKIVDRLGTMETASRGAPSGPIPVMAAQAPAPVVSADKIKVRNAPPMQPAVIPETLPSLGEEPEARKGGRSPAQAAADAALAALSTEVAAEPVRDEQPKKRSLLGGFTRALKERSVEPPQVDPVPDVALDEPFDAKAMNQPLEPGSGAPDLNAILRRVREERGQPAKGGEDAETAKSDFIAAARRAAQAAAAEADSLRRGVEPGGKSSRFSVGDFLKARRKPLLMAAAAIMIALAGLQLGKAFISNDPQVAALDKAPLVAEATMTSDAAEAQAALDTAPADVDADADADVSDATDMPAAEPLATTADAAPVPPVEVAALPAAEPATPDVAPQTPVAGAAMPAGAAAAAKAATLASPAKPEKIVVPAEAGPLSLREAAANGDAKALFEIGSRYAEGAGVKENLPKAAEWYQKSAEAGFAPAQYRIGNFFEKGIGVTRDVKQAKTWYQLAATQGNASAMHNLAVLFAMGADGQPDNESAAWWFTKAAELGVKDSQFNLGILAAKGVGVTQNLEESYKWFALVAKTGDKDAAAKRDDVANALRPDQLEKARAAVEGWTPKPLDPEVNSVEVPDEWSGTDGRTASIDMKQAVRNVQLILNKNGYDAGGADGVMGDKTRTAITRFQKDNGLDATGEISEPLVKVLLTKK